MAEFGMLLKNIQESEQKDLPLIREDSQKSGKNSIFKS